MSTEHDPHDPDLDALQRAYREAGFDDEPPRHVDAAIRAAAARAGRPRYRQYLPPLALAATIVVALGLLLRLTAPGPERPAPATPESFAPRALESAAPGESGPAAADRGSAPPMETMRMRAPAADDPAAMPAEEGFANNIDTSVPADADGPPEPDASAAAPPCAAPRPMPPDAWLACVAAALDAGAVDAARAELEAFETAYPDYPVPSALAERLAP